MKAPISVIILTYNEEIHLDRILLNVSFWADEVIIVDSGSTDKTKEIAKKYGVKFHEHPFMNQAEQFNWALDNVPIKNEWILRMDADEYLAPELIEEIKQTLASAPSGITGFFMKRRFVFMDKWIKHGMYYPVWFLRLWRKGFGIYEQREMDEHLVLNGEAAYLRHDIVDHNLNGLGSWSQKHINYAKREAAAYLRHEFEARGLGGGQVESKRWLKENVYYRSPIFLRAFLYWFYRYFIRLGFLDGKEGMIFHFLHAFWYRFLIDVNIFESTRKK